MRAAAVFLLVLGHMALCQGWRCTQGPALRNAVKVEAGLGQVVALDSNNQAYYLSGSNWTELPHANLKHISVGEAGIWAISVSGKIVKYVGGSFVEVPGTFMQLDAGGNDFVFGVNHHNHIYCLQSAATKAFNGVGNVKWDRVGLGAAGSVTYLSCGPYGCWAVNKGDQIFFLKSAVTCSYALGGWKHIVGGLVQIEVGSDGQVFGVNRPGQAYERLGVSEAVPQGTSWKGLPFGTTMKHVSYDLGTVYGVTTAGVVMKCTA